jgi:hypothetical protein
MAKRKGVRVRIDVLQEGRQIDQPGSVINPTMEPAQQAGDGE